jgi:hypothetical protein
MSEPAVDLANPTAGSDDAQAIFPHGLRWEFSDLAEWNKLNLALHKEFGKPYNVHYQYRRWRWQWSWDHTFHVWFHDSNDALIAALKFRGIYGELT